MNKRDDIKEYKKSKLTRDDLGIRITGTDNYEKLEKTKQLLEEKYSRETAILKIDKLKNKEKYRKTEGEKWDKEIRIVGTMEELDNMKEILEENFFVARTSDIYQIKSTYDFFVRYFKIRDKKRERKNNKTT